MPDPGPIADSLCEILFHGDPRRDAQSLLLQLRLGALVLDDVIVEVDRRGGLDRLLPDAPSDDAAAILDALAPLRRRDGLLRLASALVRLGRPFDRLGLNRALLGARDAGVLPAIFADLIETGLYDRLIALLTGDGATDSTTLRALAAARPTYGCDSLNAAAIAAIRAGAAAGAPYDLLIIPGYTPVGAKDPVRLDQLPAATARVDRAKADFDAGRARFLFATGGAVHPPGTPYVEALMMRDRLLARGVPADRILVDPHARHSTTNLRNAGRLMRSLGLRRALIVTGGEFPIFDQAFYMGHPSVSSFFSRCQSELGYVVGALAPTEDGRIEYTPSPDVSRPAFRDPLDW